MLIVPHAIGKEKKRGIMENAKVGETIAFKSSETILEQTPAEMRAHPAPHVQPIGSTFEKIKHESSVEHRPSYTEQIPEVVTTEQMLADNRRRWSQQDPANPDNRAL
jgi:hypothetical protein